VLKRIIKNTGKQRGVGQSFVGRGQSEAQIMEFIAGFFPWKIPGLWSETRVKTYLKN
jgi:hypothetical protein